MSCRIALIFSTQPEMPRPDDDSATADPPAADRPTRRHAVRWLGAAAALVAGAVGGLGWWSRSRRRSALRRLWRSGPEEDCRPLSGDPASPVAADDLDDLALEIARLYPWHDARDLRTLADATVLCADVPPPRTALYPELARCWEIRDRAARMLAAHGDRDRDVLDAVTDALARHRDPNITVTVAGPADLALETAVTLDSTAPFVARRLLDAPDARLDAVSTAPLESSLASGWAPAIGRLLATGATSRPTRPTAALYAEASGIDPAATPPGVERLRRRLQEMGRPAVRVPARLWLGDLRLVDGRLSALPTDRYLDLEHHTALFALADRTRPTVAATAARLHRAHAWIPAADLEATLLANLLVELFWLGPEDPWQDLGAARAFDAPIAPALAAAVDRARSAGDVAVGPLRDRDGRVLDLRLPGAWRAATVLGAPLSFQGIGPAQLIVGLVEEAGGHEVDGRPLWATYFPDRELGTAAVVAAALDLDDAVTATGLVYDYLLRRMAASLLASADTAYPADLYPFPSDHGRARRYLALALLRTFKAFPEMLWRYPNPHSFPYWHHTFNQDALVDTAAVVSAVWDLDTELGHGARVVPARAWRRPLIDHHAADDRSDGLQVVSLPPAARGGLGPLHPPA